MFASRLGRGPLLESAAGNIALAVLGTATGVLLARLLGATGRGQLAALGVPAVLISGVLMLGLPEAMVHFVRRGGSKPGGVIGACFALSAVSTITVGLGVALLVTPRLLSGLPGDVVLLGQWWMITPFLTAAGGTAIEAFRAIGHERIWNVYRVIPGLAWLIVVALAFALPNDERLRFLVVGSIASSVVLAAVAWISLRPRVDGGLSLGKHQWTQLLKYGAPLSLTSLPRAVNLRFDQLLLIPFVSSKQLGLYVAAVAFSALSSPIVSAFGIVLFPNLSATTDETKIRRLLTEYFRWSTMTAFAGAGVGMLIAPLAIPFLFGSDFSSAVGVSLILIPAGAVTACSGVVQAALLGLGRTRPVLSTELAGLVVNVVALVSLVPSYGVVGAAIASLLAYTTTFWLRVKAVLHASGVPIRDFFRVW